MWNPVPFRISRGDAGASGRGGLDEGFPASPRLRVTVSVVPGLRSCPLLGVLLVAVLAGCPTKPPAEPPARLDVLAVMEIEEVKRDQPAPVPGEIRPAGRLAPGAGRAVTAQIYRVLAERTEFRFVPDLTALDALENPEVERAPNPVERARALGKLVEAEGVIFGTVSRFEERVGTQYGATQPASVSFELGLLEVANGEVRWRGSFDQTQQPLSSNLLNFWMFWRGGPRWFTARELAGLGVERLVEDMRRAAQP